MRFDDPAHQCSFQVPLGYAYDPESSHLITVIFRHWERLDEKVYVRAMPAFAPPDATLDDWHAALEAKAFPPRMRPATRIWAGSSPAALVESHDEEPRPTHRRIMIVRGTRLDVFIEHGTPEPSAGARRSEVLKVIGETLDVPTNRFVPERVEQNAVMGQLELAAQAVQRGAYMDAIDPAMQALNAAQGMYLYSLVEDTPLPEIPAVLIQLNALFRLTQASGNILFLRNAEHLALRASYTLQHLPLVMAQRRRQIGAELAQALEAIVRLQFSIINPGKASDIQPSPGTGLAQLRSGHLEAEARKALAQGHPDFALMLCEAAVADVLMVISGLPRLSETFNTETISPKLTEDFRAGGATTPEQKRELALALITRVKLDDLVRGLRLLADLRLLTDDFVGASEASALLAPTLNRLGQPVALSFGGHLEPRKDMPALRAHALMAQASSLADVGDPQSLGAAQRLLDEAQALLDDMHEEGALRAQLCLMRASVLHSERRLDGALETIERGLRAAAADSENSKPIVLELKTIQSQFLLHAEDIDNARRVALEVISLPEGDTPRAIQNRSAHYLNLAIIDMRLADYAGAAGSLKLALDKVLRTAAFSESAYRILMVASRVLTEGPEAQRDPALAHRMNLAALANLDARHARISSDSARIGFDESHLHRQSYEELIARLIDADARDEAAAVADRSRARSLNRLIAPPSGDGTRPMPDGAAPRVHDMDSKSAFRAASDYVIGSADAQIGQQGIFRPLSAEEMQQVARDIDSPCLLIQPVHGRVALIVVRPDGDARVTYSPESYSGLVTVLQAAQDRIEQANSKPGSPQKPMPYPELDASLLALWSGLIAPVNEYIGQGQPLMIVPYRELTLVPFALLRDPDGISLIEHRPIAVTPSLATIRALRAKGPWKRLRPMKAYVAGDPAFNPGFKLNRLPAARAEAESVAKMLGKVIAQDGNLVLRVDSEAHEQSYRREARGSDLVHLSCHAELAEPAYQSRLVLAPIDQQDGLLMAAEITDVKLDDALVFLAACQTGKGRVTADGVVGLGRAFLEAGARAVVLSLWGVQDDATYALTSHFYENLLDSGAPPSAAGALRHAMLKTRDALRKGEIRFKGKPLPDHPRYWAPFFILGDAFAVRYAV